jgi:S-DNA-T family DNA segregation ATPase FtsK/SpoIIIE
VKSRSRQFVPVEAAAPRELSPRLRELLALSLIGFSLYALLSLATLRLPAPAEVDAPLPRGTFVNAGGQFGYWLAAGFSFVFGRAALLPFAASVLLGLLWFVRGRIARPTVKLLGIVLLAALFAVLLAGPDGRAPAATAAPWGPGGRLGMNLSPRLLAVFGGPGRVMVICFGALAALLLLSEALISTWLQRAGEVVERGVRRLRPVPAIAGDGAPALEPEPEPAIRPRRRAPPPVAANPAPAAMQPAEEAEDADDVEDEDPDDAAETDEADEAAEEPAAGATDPDRAEVAGEPEDATPSRRALRVRRRRPRRHKQRELPFDAAYPFPPLALFREPEPVDDRDLQSTIEKQAAAIEARLASFRVGAKVVGVSQGPAVTQFELAVETGIKVTKIGEFEADLAAALKALSVRVVAPIPGRDTVGIEVPNAERQIVVIRELLEQFGRAEQYAIPLFLGKDVGGEAIVEDLTRMPHILIAGTTGSGKSVCINAILLSILLTRTPKEVRLILIDPKMVELQAYRQVPHLSCEVVTNTKKAPGVLDWAVEEMERRYALFSKVGVNHIRSYNKLGAEEIERRLGGPIDPADAQIPYQVVVIDELADLMVVAQREIEESIQRLAQKSRAVGLHVILATQRPSTDVITGVIKANLPCQIAFKVNRKIDSRVILDCNGAEKLLGHGDMLYVPPGAHRITRAQGTFVSDEEIQRVVSFLRDNGPKPSFLPDLVTTDTGSRRRPQDKDELYMQAVEVILGQQRGSATLLQRALAIGYTRATRLLELMEGDGLVGPFQGSRSRDVMMTLDEWKQREQEIEAELERLEQEGEGEVDEEEEEEEEALDDDPGAGDGESDPDLEEDEPDPREE